MAYGSTPCKPDPSTSPYEVYERDHGFVPEGYKPVRFCHTDDCIRHVTIRPTGHTRFDSDPDETPKLPENRKSAPWTDARRLKLAQVTSKSFTSPAETWSEYCEDYLTSPQTTKEQKIAFCVHHYIGLGMTCHCGYRHNVRKHSEHADECRVYNGCSLEEYIAQAPGVDCGKAITGEAFGRISSSKVFYDAQKKHQAENQAAIAQETSDYASLYLEVTSAFRQIKTLKLKPGGENWLHTTS